MGKKSAGLILDDSRHYIDHLAPFCALQGWPLIVCEETVAHLCRCFYPDLEVIHTSLDNLDLPDTIVSCTPAKWLQVRLPHITGKQLFWLPHGHSDKGWWIPSFRVLENEIALIYGKRMEAMIRTSGSQVKMICIGNFRLRYWMKHKPFYDQTIQEHLLALPSKKTVLYAPTWNDKENNGTFDYLLDPLIRVLPADTTLIIKPHPNTECTCAARLEALQGQLSTMTNVLFLSNFPPVYPLLQHCDAYIGDMSSIGYDFLYFDRPLYLFCTEQKHSLYAAAQPITTESLSTIFTSHPLQNPLRTILYEETFDRSAAHCL